jgi:hypothetical protein
MFITTIYWTGLISPSPPFWKKVSCFKNRNAFQLFYDWYIWYIDGQMCCIFVIRYVVSNPVFPLWKLHFDVMNWHMFISPLYVARLETFICSFHVFILYARSCSLIYKNIFHMLSLDVLFRRNPP